MARPKKNNADYFSHDSDMRNDPKIRALRRKFGLEGYAIWCMFLETLTHSDFFEYEWSELNIELLAGDFDIDPEKLRTIINYCLTLKLLKLDKNTIYSAKMKERFDTLLGRRKQDRKRKTKELSEVNEEFSARKTPEENVFRSESTQSKVKESKVKESKVKVDDEEASKEESYFDIDALLGKYLANERLVQAVMESQKFQSKEELTRRLRDFNKQLSSTGQFVKTWKDYTSHFKNWHKKSKPEKKSYLPTENMQVI